MLTWSKRTYGRSGGRSDGSDVITKPKFLGLMGLPKSLSYGAPPSAPAAQARPPLQSGLRSQREKLW